MGTTVQILNIGCLSRPLQVYRLRTHNWNERYLQRKVTSHTQEVDELINPSFTIPLVMIELFRFPRLFRSGRIYECCSNCMNTAVVG